MPRPAFHHHHHPSSQAYRLTPQGRRCHATCMEISAALPATAEAWAQNEGGRCMGSAGTAAVSLRAAPAEARVIQFAGSGAGAE